MAQQTEIDLLNTGISLMAASGKIDSVVQGDLTAFLDTIPYYKGFKVGYESFDQSLGSGLTFNDSARSVLTTSPFVLITKPIVLTNSILFGLKIIATLVEGISIQYSSDGANYYNISDIDIYINLTSPTFFLKLSGSIVTTISKLFVLYI
jgi:hypothetical protein